MQYLAHQSYTLTKHEWMHQIPSHWQLTKLKFACRINPTKSEVGHLSQDTEVSFLPMELIGEDGSIKLTESRRIGSVFQGFTYFRDGDVIVAKITPCFENGKGALAHNLTNGLGFGTTELHVLRPLDHVSAEYVYYITRSELFRKTGTALMVGAAGQKRVPPEFVADFEIGLPGLSEQQAIADFLDRETAVIDALVAKKRELIERLQEKRAALISHAVTKGLDPTVPMKDSGVEWLGEIPAHWEVVRFKFVTPSITVGIVITPSKYYVDEGVPCLRSLNVREGYLQDVDLVYISPESNQLLNKSIIYQGDLVSVRTGQPGTTAVVDERFHGANCIDLIITRQSTQFDSFFMAYYLNSLPAKSQFASHSSGAIQQHFNINTAQNLTIPFPTIDEQIAIRNYLDQEDKNLNNLIEKVQDAIERLQEYRTALISAAVTGKIDVRPQVQGDC